MNRVGYIVLFIVVIVIAATSSWLLRRIDPQPFNILKPVQHNMDYFLTDFNSTIMNLSGIPQYTIKGTRLEHFPDDSSFDITQPDIKLFRGKRPPWLVKSKTARILSKKGTIYLNGKTSMNRAKSKNELAINLDTSNVTIYTEKDFAETKDNVHIYTKKHDIKAKGMRVYLAEGRLELLSNVRGTYDVQ